MIRWENWADLLKKQPLLCIDLMKVIDEESKLLQTSNEPDEDFAELIEWAHSVLEEHQILSGFDTLLADYNELLKIAL